MRAGKLRHRVTIQKNTPSQNDLGEAIASWSTVATVWAAVEPLQGREFFEARQEQADVTTRIRIRWRDDVSVENRVTWTDPANTAHVYDITAVLADPTHLWQLVLMCKSVAV